MTKKFVHTDSKRNTNSVAEFLVPDIWNKSNSLIGLKSKLSYGSGIIVFTGVGLDENIIIKRIEENERLTFLQKLRAKNRIKKYIEQIANLKIGDSVSIGDKGELVKISQSTSLQQ